MCLGTCCLRFNFVCFSEPVNRWAPNSGESALSGSLSLSPSSLLCARLKPPSHSFGRHTPNPIARKRSVCVCEPHSTGFHFSLPYCTVLQASRRPRPETPCGWTMANKRVCTAAATCAHLALSFRSRPFGLCRFAPAPAFARGVGFWSRTDCIRCLCLTQHVVRRSTPSSSSIQQI